MLRSRWRSLGVVALAMIWCLALWRSWGRPSRPAVTPVPVHQAPQAVEKAPAAPVAPAAPTPPTALPAAPIAPAPVAAPAAPAPVAAPVAAPTDPAAEAAAQTVHDKVWSAVPSVTSDGSRIFVPFRFAYPARGESNLYFDLWNRRGKKLQSLVVQDDQCADPGCPPDSIAQVRAQELAAAKFLTELERKGLHPLQEGVVDDESEKVYGIGGPSHTRARFTAEGAKAPSLTVELSETGVLTVQPRGHAAITRQSSAWRLRPTPEQARQMQAAFDKGEVGCFNPATLRAPLVDVSRRVAVVTIGYRGNDSCWESGDDYTVVTW